MKKIIYLFFINLISLNVFAANKNFPQGLFLGVAGGFNHTDSSLTNMSASVPAVNGIINFNNASPSLNSALIQGLAGYLHVFDQMPISLGGEIFYSYSGAEKKFETDTINEPVIGGRGKLTTTFKHQNEMGIKILMGYIFDKVNHPYITAGYSKSFYNLKNQASYITNATGEIDEKTAASDFSTNNFLIGAGFERSEGNIRYGLEGIYRFGQKTKRISTTVFYNGAGSDAFSNTDLKIKNSYTALFKFTYNFNLFS